MKKYIIILFLIMTFGIETQAQNQNNKFHEEKISAELLLHDINQLLSLHERYNPSYYLFHSKKEMDTIISQMKSQINKDLTRIEFNRIILPYIKAIGEGHNCPFYKEDLFSQYITNGGVVIPFDVYSINSRYYVNKCRGKIEIPIGSEILSINSMSVPKINEIIKKSVVTDGFIEPNIDFEINRGGGLWHKYVNYISNFPKNDSIIDIEYRAPNTDSIVHISVEGVKLSIKKRSPDVVSNEPAPFTLKYFSKDDAAYMQIKTFDDRNSKWGPNEFKYFFEHSFKELKQRGIVNLILDIRGNPGGNGELADELIKYLTIEKYLQRDESCIFVDTLAKTEGKNISELYKNRCINKSGKTFYGEGDIIKNNKRKLTFDGNLFVLIDEPTFSAATWLASYIKSNKLGTIIGRETNGHCGGTTAGHGSLFTLENSRLQVPVQHVYYEYSLRNQKFGTGVIPDVIVNYSKDEVVEKKDVILNTAFKLIKKKKK